MRTTNFKTTLMIKTLTPIGEGLGFVIDKTLLEELRISRDTPLRITSDGKGFYVEPLPAEEGSKFLRAGRRMMDIHEEAFRGLAE
jgi:hypothetical protein